MVAIPVLIRSGLDEEHEENSENDEDRQGLGIAGTYINKTVEKKGRDRKKGENGVMNEIVKLSYIKLFLSYHLLAYNMGFSVLFIEILIS